MKKIYKLAFITGWLLAVFMSVGVCVLWWLYLDASIDTVATVAPERTAITICQCPVATQPAVATPAPTPEPYWWSDEDLDLLSRVVMAEAGGTGNDEVMQGVAAVVINRVNHDEFPNTIWDVVFQDGQYACADYLESVEPTDCAVENALIALCGGTNFPADVVWQSSVAQTAYGCEVSVYKEFDTTPYRTVFCHYGNNI